MFPLHEAWYTIVRRTLRYMTVIILCFNYVKKSSRNLICIMKKLSDSKEHLL